MNQRTGEFEWEPPCFAHIKFVGRISEDQARYLMQSSLDCARGLPYVLMVFDISEMTGASPESRRVSAVIMREMPPRALAVLGGGFGERMVSKLVLKATEMLGRTRQTSAFFQDKRAARKWLEEQRDKFEAEGLKA